MWTVPLGPKKPIMELEVEGQWFEGILDTGAEISCFPETAAHNWGVLPGPRVIGATGTAPSFQTSRDLIWKDKEGRQGTFRPLVLPGIDNILWGRDVLSNCGAILSTAPPQ